MSTVRLSPKKSLSRRIWAVIQRDWPLYVMMIPGLLFFAIYKYAPMYGIQIAFKDYAIRKGINGSPWANPLLKWFTRFFGSRQAQQIISNTLILSMAKIVCGLIPPLFLALAFSECRWRGYTRVMQTISYLPHFISTVVVAGMVISFTDMNGLINNFLGVFGVPAQEWLVKAKNFPAIYTVTNVWKGFGFGSILYFSSLSSIDPQMYEAARIDGANRWQQMRFITLPSLAFIIAVQLVMKTGQMLQSNRDLILLLYRSSNATMSDTISTYVYRQGIEGGKYSLATAVGFFSSMISLMLTFITNKISNRISGYGLW